MKISYELAKELKDAGFPQHKRFPLSEQSIEELKKRGFEEVHFPELSELIEAVGNEVVVDAIIQREIIMIDVPSVARLWLSRNKNTP